MWGAVDLPMLLRVKKRSASLVQPGFSGQELCPGWASDFRSLALAWFSHSGCLFFLLAGPSIWRDAGMGCERLVARRLLGGEKTLLVPEFWYFGFATSHLKDSNVACFIPKHLLL